MVLSMTSFGQGCAQAQEWQCEASIKSVNSRYLEIHLHLPQCLETQHAHFRRRINEEVFRGKLSVRFEFTRFDDLHRQINLNESVIKAYIEDFSKISGLKTEEIPAGVYIALLGMPNVYEKIADDLPEELAKELALAALNDALRDHRMGAKREGELLQKAVEDDLKGIKKALRHIDQRLPKIEKDYKERLRFRLDKELDKGLWDELRLHQEIALFVEKTDIAEEVVRLESHVDGLVKLFAQEEFRAIGKEADFFLQEMNREANTIGSKIQDPEVTPFVVEIKKHIEQCRQQVQNIA